MTTIPTTTTFDEIDALKTMLCACRTQFAFYQRQHMAKDPPQLEKAAVNQDMVDQITAVLGDRLCQYDPNELPEHLRWQGEGPPPAHWYVGNTKVYRSYADYCDD